MVLDRKQASSIEYRVIQRVSQLARMVDCTLDTVVRVGGVVGSRLVRGERWLFVS